MPADLTAGGLYELGLSPPITRNSNSTILQSTASGISSVHLATSNSSLRLIQPNGSISILHEGFNTISVSTANVYPFGSSSSAALMASSSTICTTSTESFIYLVDPVKYAKSFIKSILKQRSAPAHLRYKPELFPKDATAELRARKLLREVLTEAEYFRYLRRGFVTKKGMESGMEYAIPVNGHTIVLDAGKPIEELCINVDRICPPADRMYTLISLLELGESFFRASANVRSLRKKQWAPSPIENPRLLDVWKMAQLGSGIGYVN